MELGTGRSRTPPLCRTPRPGRAVPAGEMRADRSTQETAERAWRGCRRRGPAATLRGERRPGTPAYTSLRGRQPRGWATRLSPPADIGASPKGVIEHASPAAGAPRALSHRVARAARRLDRRRQGDPRQSAARPWPPLPARRGDALGRCPGGLLRTVSYRRRLPRRRIRGLLRRAL